MLSLIDPCSRSSRCLPEGLGSGSSSAQALTLSPGAGPASSALMFSRSQEPVGEHQCLEYLVPKTPKKANEVDAWQLCGRGLQAENKVGDSTCSADVGWLRRTPPTWMAGNELSSLNNGNKGKERWWPGT